MTPADRLRDAARALRDGGRTLMEEDVALALADWLDHTASQVALFDATHDMEGSPLAALMPRGAIDAIGRPALAVADAVLGGERR